MRLGDLCPLMLGGAFLTGCVTAGGGPRTVEPSPRTATVMRQIESDPWTARYRRLYAREGSLKTVRTLAEHVLYMNDPDRIRVGHGAYLVGGFKLGPEAEYLGVDDATSWYNRNLRIFSNLQHITSDSADRILLIIGAGHLSILRFLAQASPEYRLREPAEFITRR